MLNQDKRHWDTSLDDETANPEINLVACPDVGCYDLDKKSSLPFRWFASLLFGFHLIKQFIESLETLFPELAVPLEPFSSLRQRFGLKPAGPPLSVTASRDQARTFEHLEMFGDRRLTHREWFRQFGHRR